MLRPLISVFSVLTGVVALSLAWLLPPGVLALAASTTALVMGGTFHPLLGPTDSPQFVTAYLDNAVTGHLDPAFGAESGAVTNSVAVYTPEEFFPLGRLTFEKSLAEGLANLGRCVAAQSGCVFNDDPGVQPAVGSVAPQPGDTLRVFGYSQSAAIASLLKRELIAHHGPDSPAVSFVLSANPMRPNGGILMRFRGWPTIPILGIPFPGASPTDSPDGVYQTVDIVRQYDGLGGDFPVRPLNLVATLNALLGYGMMHGETVDVPLSEAHFQGREGDTRYYLIQTDLVPLLQPFQLFVPKPILKAFDAPLRVIIEDAYDRDVGPGVPTRASWRPFGNVVGMAARLLASLPVAVDNLTEGFGLGRVLGTAAPGTFGVGRPGLPADDSEIVAENTKGERVSSSVAEGTEAAAPDRGAPQDEAADVSVDETAVLGTEPADPADGGAGEQLPDVDEPAETSTSEVPEGDAPDASLGGPADGVSGEPGDDAADAA